MYNSFFMHELFKCKQIYVKEGCVGLEWELRLVVTSYERRHHGDASSASL